MKSDKLSHRTRRPELKVVNYGYFTLNEHLMIMNFNASGVHAPKC